MRSITINALNPNSIDGAIGWLEKYKRYIELGTEMALDECVDVGSSSAMQYLAEGLNDAVANGERDIVDTDIWKEKISNTEAKYCAPGDTVWIEFGTGVHNNESGYGSYPHDYYSFGRFDGPPAASLGMDAIGKYQHTHYNKYEYHSEGYYDSWVYTSKVFGIVMITNGIPCNPFMLRSVNEVASKMKEIIKKAFRL